MGPEQGIRKIGRFLRSAAMALFACAQRKPLGQNISMAGEAVRFYYDLRP